MRIIIIPEEECNNLEKYWYEYNAMMNLIVELSGREIEDSSVIEMALEKYTEAYIRFNLYGEAIVHKHYGPYDTWEVNFTTGELIIDGGECSCCQNK